MSTSTSHASDSEIYSIDITPVIIDTTCLENSCITNHVMPKSKDTGTQAHGKFVPTCHNCGKIGHIRPNCYLLKSHRPWIKQDDLRKSEVEDSSSTKYVPPHRRHIKKVSAMLFVRMLTIILQRMSRSIQTKEACPPVITAASSVTSDPYVHISKLRSRRFKRSFQQELHQAFYLRQHIRHLGISNSLFLPTKVANQRRTNQGATRERSPLATMAMKSC
jgi:hypothetical protein